MITCDNCNSGIGSRDEIYCSSCFEDAITDSDEFRSLQKDYDTLEEELQTLQREYDSLYYEVKNTNPEILMKLKLLKKIP